MTDIVSISVATIAIIAGGFLYAKSRQLNADVKKREEETNRRMYELAILKELGDRIGYSLNVQNIIDIISGSLHQFIEYGAVSYMLLEPEKIIFKVDLEESVSRKFVDEVRDRMLNSLSALLNKEFKKEQVEEVLTGAILVEEIEKPVQSFFNIPLIIGGSVVGVLTVAHTNPGLYKEEEMTILYKITEQASQAVTKLQEVVETEQRKLNAMVESMSEGVVMTDNDYRIAVVNPKAKRIVGLEDKDEFSIFDFIDNLEGKFDIRGKLEESVKLDKVLTLDEVFIRERWYQIHVSPVKSSYGMEKNITLGGVVIFHDVTHEKEIEQLREDFRSMMVHELRSPLDGIKKMSELMISEDITTAKKEFKEYTSLIRNDATRMLDLVNDLLEVAKLESGKFEIDKQPGDISNIMNNRLTFFESAAQSANINLSIHHDERTPKKSFFDEHQIIQVLNNYISNALKFTDSGGKVVIQSLFHERGADIEEEATAAQINWYITKDDKNLSTTPASIILAVTDSGSGIPQSQIPKLFTKFKQLKYTEQKGTGLGLVIVKGIIDAHGGIVGVASIEGEGSTFYATIPIEQATNEDQLEEK